MIPVEAPEVGKCYLCYYRTGVTTALVLFRQVKPQPKCNVEGTHVVYVWYRNWADDLTVSTIDDDLSSCLKLSDFDIDLTFDLFELTEKEVERHILMETI